MNKGKGFDRLRLAAAVVTAAGGLFGAARSARAGTGATIVQGGASWGVFNQSQGPGTAPFLPATCTFGKRPDRSGKPQPDGPRGTGDGCAMNVTSAAIGQQGDAYDGIFLMAVNGVQYRDPDGAFTSTANSVSGSAVALSGLSVTGDYFFFATAPVVRAVYNFTNPTAASITATVAIGYNVGSDSNTQVEATADGDLIVESVDGWQVSSDNGGATRPLGNSDPVVTLSRFGTGAGATVASSTVVLAAGEQDQIDNYAITVPANSTRRLMLFSRISTTVPVAIAAAPQFNSLATLNTNGFLAGLSAQQQAEIVNWSPAAPTGGGTSFISNVPTLGDWGRIALALALGGIAFVATRRLRNPGTR